MFGDKNKQKNQSPAPAATATVIGPDSIFEGLLKTKSSVLIQGVVRGKIHSEASLILNEGGVIEADIVAEHVVIHGNVTGNIDAKKQIDIGDSGKVTGDVVGETVTISKGGVLEGFCKMSAPGAAGEGEAKAPAKGETTAHNVVKMDEDKPARTKADQKK